MVYSPWPQKSKRQDVTQVMIERDFYGKLYRTDSRLDEGLGQVGEIRNGIKEESRLGLEKEVKVFPDRGKSLMKPMRLEPQVENLLHVGSD